MPVLETKASLQPDTKSLASGLTSVLGISESADFAILNRERNGYSSGSFSEIVTCGSADGQQLKLLIKYGRHPDSASYTLSANEEFVVAAWSNVPYEAEVYRQLLQPLQAGTAKFYGTYQEPWSGRLWLVLDYFENAAALDELEQASLMPLAADWLGRFHAACQERMHLHNLAFLQRHDASFYVYRARRALSCAGGFQNCTWLPELCCNFETLIRALWPMRPTITHGDYYRHNILFHGVGIHPIDWECAAIDLGEVDLACFTDCWPADIRRACEIAYLRARWPEGAPDDFSHMLDAARLCLYFFDAGRIENWAVRREGARLRRKLKVLGQRLQLI